MRRCITIMSVWVWLLAAWHPAAWPQPTKRIILKDGSYQAVTKWEIAGDRVRYWSAERRAWEEVPSALVDWPATESYNESATRRAASPADGQQDDAVEADEDGPPLAAPGLRLPDGGGVFLLDAYQGQPQMVELTQNGGALNRHTGRNILRAAINPLALSSKQTIELGGDHAKVQSHLPQPAIYVNVDSGSGPEPTLKQQPSQNSWPAEHYGIVRLEKKNGKRLVGNLDVAVYGKVSQKENWIKTASTTVGEWTKLTPADALAPGEYAVVERLGKDQINLYVWDFGVDPAAPANPDAWTAGPKEPGLKNPSAGPVLERRPKL